MKTYFIIVFLYRIYMYVIMKVTALIPDDIMNDVQVFGLNF
jgi:hypothetical protein